uniref:Uncharacterized protein n=1 Tax=Rhizophora mucronata TaxID=61149 RepID=A0A2P2PGU5_RHIMU
MWGRNFVIKASYHTFGSPPPPSLRIWATRFVVNALLRW